MTALTLVFALVSPANAAVTDLTLTPESDTIPAGNCNAFTVHLTGDSQTEYAGQTIDVEVEDTDADNPNTPQNEATSPVSFCTPDATATNANYNQSGPNPQPGQPDENTELNFDSDCEAPFFADPQPAGCNGTISGETGPTDSNGDVTFGIISNDPGTYSVTAYYDADDSDTLDNGEQFDTSQKTFTAPVSPSQCSDNADNDADGLTDYPSDPGCLSAGDNDETDNPGPVPPQCSDGFDNDNDGRTDFGPGGDGGCQSATDNDETGNGNRRLATAVTIRYNRPVHAFKGTLANAAKKCRINRRIVLKRKVPGKDPVVKRTRSTTKGTYLIPKRRVRGKTWYTVAKPKQFDRPNGGTVFCLKGRSIYLTLARK